MSEVKFIIWKKDMYWYIAGVDTQNVDCIAELRVDSIERVRTSLGYVGPLISTNCHVYFCAGKG